MNLTEEAATRICHAEKPVRGLIGKVDNSLQHFICSGKNIQRSPVVDTDELIKTSWKMMFSAITRDEVTDILKDLKELLWLI